ncbi:hypothetical protein V6N13_148802 [Hibiscus sabdariffa]
MDIRARKDTILIGFQKGELAQQNILEGESEEDIYVEQVIELNVENLTWAERFDMLNSLEPSQGDKCDPNLTRVSHSQPSLLGNSSKRSKRYGPLRFSQEKALSTVERKKRDRSQKINKKNYVDRELSDLEGRSLSESDIHARCIIYEVVVDLSWSIKGIGFDLNVTELKKLIRLHRVEVVFIQDLKKVTTSGEVIRRRWYDDEFDFRFSGAVG